MRTQGDGPGEIHYVGFGAGLDKCLGASSDDRQDESATYATDRDLAA
jgi:hypothetical protein